MISPCCGFSFAVSGMYSPPRICSASSIGLTTTRSANGATFTPEALFVAIASAPPKELVRCGLVSLDLLALKTVEC